MTSQMHHPLGSLRQLSDTEFLPLEQLPKELKELLNKLVAAKVYYGSEPLLLRYLNPDKYKIRVDGDKIISEQAVDNSDDVKISDLDLEETSDQKPESNSITLSVRTGVRGEKKLHFRSDSFRCKDCAAQQPTPLSASELASELASESVSQSNNTHHSLDCCTDIIYEINQYDDTTVALTADLHVFCWTQSKTKVAYFTYIFENGGCVVSGHSFDSKHHQHIEVNAATTRELLREL